MRKLSVALIIAGVALVVLFLPRAFGAALCDSGDCPSVAALHRYEAWNRVGWCLILAGVVGLVFTWLRRRRPSRKRF